MAHHKAADDEVANAEQGLEASRTGFGKALAACQKAGRKTAYSAP